MTNIPQDTICAIASAQGGAIGIIRVSGPDAITLTSQIFTPAKADKTLMDAQPYTLTFGYIHEEETIIDEVLVSLFRAPHSYTGENSTEIACHGSSYILQKILQLLIKQGCRLAHPGEYTQRAFLNGKMDLSQAEAVADLIASTSAATHRLAMNQMRGGFSTELKRLRDRLLHFTALIELELDFSDHEELEFADRTQLLCLAHEIEQAVSRLVHSFKIGNALKNGIPVTIIGETNAGKSTLLNALVGEERAIVSDIHGTTRDVIEDTINLEGITFRFIDTAGIRQTTDRIENLGIERTFQKLHQAEIVLLLVDATCALAQLASLLPHILSLCGDKQLILVLNKVDLVPDYDETELVTALNKELLSTYPSSQRVKYISISAKQGTGIDTLQQILLETAQLPMVTQNDIIVTNTRHYEALTHALDAIHRVQQGLDMEISGDFLAQDIRECIFHLSDIVGEVTTNEVLNHVFEHFCIGK